MKIYEEKVLAIDKGDYSYTFIKPDSEIYKGKVIELYQDAYGRIESNIYGREELARHLDPEELHQVMSWLHKPQLLEFKMKEGL